MDNQTKTAWETVRALIFYLYNMNPYVKKRPKKLTDIFKLDWDKDKKKEVPEMSLQEMKQKLKIIYKVFNKKKNVENK